MKTGFVMILVGLIMAIAACEQRTTPSGPSFHVEVISSRDLPFQYQGVTYAYKFASANPESLLTLISIHGIPWNQAWQPLDNMCMDPMGPRFTVQLQKEDKRLENFNFERGSGRLACASKLNRYIP